MKKTLLWIVVLMFAIVGVLAACGDDGAEEVDANEEQNIDGEVEENKDENEQENKQEESSESSDEAKSELSAEEEIALQYIELFYNGNDLTAREEFITSSVHDDSQELLKLIVGVEYEVQMNDPVVIASTDYVEDGIVDGKLVLIESGDKQGIALFNEGKFTFFFEGFADDEDFQRAFAELFSEF